MKKEHLRKLQEAQAMAEVCSYIEGLLEASRENLKSTEEERERFKSGEEFESWKDERYFDNLITRNQWEIVAYERIYNLVLTKGVG